MPVLNKVEISNEQIFDLVRQLEFKNKMELLKEITGEQDYRKNYYAYTEGLAREYDIPRMSEE